MKIKRLTLSALFTSLALVLSYMEKFFPLQLFIPLPGVKLGLANIVMMTAIYFIGWKEALAILVIRCMLASIFSGSITSLCMSLSGGLLSLLVMLAAKKVHCFSVYGVSILGAAAHNLGQIIAASLLLYSRFAFGYLPFLLITAVISGSVTGLIAAAVFRLLRAGGFRNYSDHMVRE
ncbi:MAG: Gx transporter family protein [Eubacteriales bacterium]|nr:Gx transporter family protein [Eubacteriales bacterium]